MREWGVMKLLGVLICVIFFLVELGPIFWMVLNSFKPVEAVISENPFRLFSPTLDNYVKVLVSTMFPKNLLNSLIVSVISLGVGLSVSILAAFAAIRLSPRNSRGFLFWILSNRFIPPASIAVSIYLMWYKLGLIGSASGLAIVYLTLVIPFATWMLSGFISQIPQEVEEAALVDGCSLSQVLLHIILPCLSPSIVAVSIFCLILTWNELLFASILTQAHSATVAVGVAAFVGLFDIDWGATYAAGVLATVPVYVYALLTRKRLVENLTLGAVK